MFGGAGDLSGVVAGNRGVRSGRWRCRSGRGRPPPRPVGISVQARSVTAGAGLAFRGRLAGAPGPLRAAGIADLGTARRVNPEPKDPKGGLTRLDGPGTSRLATARPGVDGCQVPAAGGAVRLRATVSTDAGTRVRMMWTPSAGRGQSGRPRRWGAGPRRPVDAGPGPHGDRLPAVSSPPLTCKAPSAPRSVPARAASSEGCEVQNSRMAEAMASSRARSSSVPRAALLWPERVTPVRRRGRVRAGRWWPATPTDGANSSTRRCDGRTAPRRRYIGGFAGTGAPSTSRGLMGVRRSGSGLLHRRELPQPPAGRGRRHSDRRPMGATTSGANKSSQV